MAVRLEIRAANDLKPCTWKRIVFVIRLRLKGAVSRILLKNKIWTCTKVMLLNPHFWASVYVLW